MKALSMPLLAPLEALPQSPFFFPLNTIRMKMQIDESFKGVSVLEAAKRIISSSDDGIAQLYQGLRAQIICLACSNFIYFYSYNSLKVLTAVMNKDAALTPVRNLMVASVAGVINVLLTSPLWMICTQIMMMGRKDKDGKLKVGKIPGVIEHGRSIYEQEGAGALWAGVIPSLWLVSNPSVQFVVYERIRVYMTSVAERRKSAITAIEFFAMGALAKAAATYVTYPLQIAQSRLRADRKGKKDENGKMAPRKYKGTMDCLAKLLQKDGVQNGWYQGINAKLLQTVLTAAFQFLTYEQIQLAVFRTLGIQAAASGPASFVEKKK